jgi:hypothetical protein
MDTLRPGKLRRLIPWKMSLEYPAFESDQERFSRLDRGLMCLAQKSRELGLVQTGLHERDV